MAAGRKLIQAFLDILFPPFCLDCGSRLNHRRPPHFCLSCLGKIRPITKPWCSCCGLPLGSSPDHLCGECLKITFTFSRARSLLHYQEPISTAIHRFKYNGDMSPLRSFQTMAGSSACLEELTQPDLILPVPLHKKRLQERGFNQALIIAKHCFSDHQNQIDPFTLIRHRYTSPQTGQSGKERRVTLKNAFSLKTPEKIKGRKILLIDDVFTTGTTVNECSKTLIAAGASQVEVFTLARAA